MTMRKGVYFLIEEASRFTGVKKSDIVAPNKLYENAYIRFAIMLVAKENLPASLTAIARALGRRDHTTTLHGARRAKELMDDPKSRVKEIVEHLLKALKDDHSGN